MKQPKANGFSPHNLIVHPKTKDLNTVLSFKSVTVCSKKKVLWIPALKNGDIEIGDIESLNHENV